MGAGEGNQRSDQTATKMLTCQMCHKQLCVHIFSKHREANRDRERGRKRQGKRGRERERKCAADREASVVVGKLDAISI